VTPPHHCSSKEIDTSASPKVAILKTGCLWVALVSVGGALPW